MDKVRRNYRNKGVNEGEMKISPVTEDYIYRLLRKLDRGKSTGLDDLPAKFIVDSAEVTKQSVTHIVNLSITSSQVPRELKSARVVPIFKKQSRLDAGNYRPVSVLCILSVRERVSNI